MKQRMKKYARGGAIVVTLGAMLLTGLLFVSARNDDETLVRQWTHEIVDGDVHCDESACTTTQFMVPFSANTISVQAESFDGLRIRLQEGGVWSGWNALDGESDVPDGEKDTRPYALVFARAVQVVQIQAPTRGNHISLTALAVPKSEKPSLGRVRMAVDQEVQAPHVASIISRSGWLDAGLEMPQAREDTLWPKEYAQDKKFIIHHTATVTRDANGDGKITGDDYREAVRAIYSYHTFSRGWGDIGYNYIIDPDGTIWEGRTGGDGVIAGHARRGPACTKFGTPNIGFNDGTIGIALLGTYDTQGISISAYDALVRLIAQKSWELNIDPAGSGFFKDKIYPNVLGHRDVDCTDCPGVTVTAGLPDIIRAAKTRHDELAGEYPRRIAGRLVDVVPTSIEMKPGDENDVTVRFRNTGTVAWRNYGSEKLVLARNDITRHIAAIDSVHIAVVDDGGKDGQTIQESSNPKDYFVATLQTPNVNPGQIGTFSFHLTQAPTEYHSVQKFVLAVGENGWLAGSQVEIPVTNSGLEYAAQSDGDLHVTIADDDHAQAQVQFMNKGTRTWTRGEVTFGVVGIDGGEFPLKDVAQKIREGKITFNEKTVAPGEKATFTISLSGKIIGDTVGMVSLTHSSEKISGSDERPLIVTVVPSYIVELSGKNIPRIIQNTWRPTVSMTIKNTGTKEIKSAQLLAHNTDGTSPSVFYHSSWDSKKVVDTISIKPGKTATVIFKIAPPKKKGEYAFVLTMKAGKKDVYFSSADGLTKELKQPILVDEAKKDIKKTVKKK